MATEQSIVGSLAHMDSDRMRRYRENLEFYRGEQWQTRARSGEKHLTFNYAKVAIDKITSYLMSSINFAVDPRETSQANQEGAKRAEDALYQVYQDNHLDQLDFDTEIDCAILGDAAYKVIWDAAEKRVRVTSPDVQGLYAWWHPDDPSRIYRVASRYQLTSDEVKLLYQVKPQGKHSWIVELWTDSSFELWIDNQIAESKVNPYGFIPFVIYPNLREPKQFWGTSDIPVLMEPQREINRALSQLSRILELSGNPIAVLENIESSEDIQVRPGAVWNIPEDARAYLLDLLQGGGVRMHIEYIDMLYRTLHDISEAPRSAFGGIERDISGIALEIDLQPLLQKIKRKRLTRTAAYMRRNQMVLSLLERFAGESFGPVNHRIVWGAVLPADLARQVTAEQMLVQTGIHSRKTAMDELGIRDPEAEFQSWLDEQLQILQMNKQLNGMRPKPHSPAQPQREVD